MSCSRVLLLVAALSVALTCGAPLGSKKTTAEGTPGKQASGGRSGRALLAPAWYDYLPSGGVEDQFMGRGAADEDPLNSPIYYIRLPPNPYTFVPGLGYVSRPDPSQLQSVQDPLPPPPPPSPPVRRSPFIQLPLEFVSNGKPGNTVLTWPSEPLPVTTPRPTTQRPAHTKPSVTKLKGPYFFNGKPSGLFILQQDPYSSLYADVLHNFYP